MIVEEERKKRNESKQDNKLRLNEVKLGRDKNFHFKQGLGF